MKLFRRQGRALLLTAVLGVAAFAAGAAAQDTAYVPIKVNVAATVSAIGLGTGSSGSFKSMDNVGDYVSGWYTNDALSVRCVADD